MFLTGYEGVIIHKKLWIGSYKILIGYLNLLHPGFDLARDHSPSHFNLPGYMDEFTP